MTRYFIVMFGDFSGNEVSLGGVWRSKFNKVAILDCDTLVCRWVDFEPVRGDGRTTVTVQGIGRVTDRFIDKNGFDFRDSFDMRIFRPSTTSIRVEFRQRIFNLYRVESGLYWNQLCLLKSDRLSEVDFRLVMLCNSDDGIFRFVLNLVVPNAGFKGILNLWLDSENIEFLCYAWGFALRDGVHCFSGLSALGQEKYDRLSVRLGKSVLFCGEGRLF